MVVWLFVAVRLLIIILLPVVARIVATVWFLTRGRTDPCGGGQHSSRAEATNADVTEAQAPQKAPNGQPYTKVPPYILYFL